MRIPILAYWMKKNKLTQRLKIKVMKMKKKKKKVMAKKNENDVVDDDDDVE